MRRTRPNWTRRPSTRGSERTSAIRVRDLVGIVAEVQATPAAELSLLWALYSIIASNGFDDMVSVTDGAQQDRFVGGSQLVSIKAASAWARPSSWKHR